MPVVGFSLYCELLNLADYGQGIERFTAIVFGAVLTFLLSPVLVRSARVVLVGLIVVGAIFFAFRTFEASRAIVGSAGPTVDVGTTTLGAVDLVRAGANPYTEFVDSNGAETNPGGTGFRYAAGYKYGPVMIWTYMPPVTLLGPDGYFALNWLALMVTAGAAYMLVAKGAGLIAGVGAFGLSLVPGILGRELFEAGFNDIVPVAFALIAFVLRERDYPIAAGIALGLSFGTKSIPAAIVALPLLLMRKDDRLPVGIAAVATAVVGHLPWLVTSTPELVAGLLTFNLTRTIDDTSILHWIPSALHMPLKALVLGSVLAFSARYARAARERGFATFCSLVVTALAASFAASPAVHGNYLLWYFPFIAVAVAAHLWRTEEGQAQPSS